MGGEHDLLDRLPGQVAQGTSRKRMLFVDDEQSVRLTLPSILAKHGFDVTSVANVKDALAEIQTQKFDILLSDLNLPEKNGGLTLIEEMRKFQPGCINFVMTSHPTDESFQRATGHEVAHYFIKPVEVEGMIDTIKQRLATPPPPRAV
jgi:two-component system response regulator GlrR